MSDEKKSPYGPVIMGRSEGTAISLPEELRDGGTLDFSDWDPIGWEYDGVLHYFPGRGPDDHPGWEFQGRIEYGEEEENG